MIQSMVKYSGNEEWGCPMQVFFVVVGVCGIVVGLGVSIHRVRSAIKGVESTSWVEEAFGQNTVMTHLFKIGTAVGFTLMSGVFLMIGLGVI